MIKTRIAVLSTCLMVIAGGAFAQDNAKKAEELRRSSEMMKPPTDAPSGAMNKGGSSTRIHTESVRVADSCRPRPGVDFSGRTRLVAPSAMTHPGLPES